MKVDVYRTKADKSLTLHLEAGAALPAEASKVGKWDIIETRDGQNVRPETIEDIQTKGYHLVKHSISFEENG